MKNLIVLFVTLVFCQLRAEWKMPLQDNSHQSFSGCIVNKNLRFAVERNYIYSSVDQGKTWIKDSFALNLTDKYAARQIIQFAGETNGYIFTILQDINNNEPSLNLFRTTDGGKTWKEVSTDLQIEVNYQMRFQVEDQELFIISQKKIVHSDLTGQHWNELATLPEGAVHDFRKSGGDMYLLCNGTRQESTLYMSSNNGHDWQLIHHFDEYKTDENDSFFSFLNYFIESDMQVRGNNIYMVFNIYTPSCGLAYLHTDIYHIKHGIHSWNVEKLPKFKTNSWDHINRICFISDDTAYMASDNTIYKSVDGGRSWFATFKEQNYENGGFRHIAVVDGQLMVYTDKGIAVINDNSHKDINLRISGVDSRDGGVLVFPNPAGSRVNFVLSSALPEFNLSVINDIGQVVFENRYFNVSSFDVDMENFAKGNYIYTISSASFNHSGKISIR